MDEPERVKDPILMIGADDRRLAVQINRMLDDPDADLDALLGFTLEDPDEAFDPYLLPAEMRKPRQRLFRRVLERRHRLDGIDGKALDIIARIADELMLQVDPDQECVAVEYDCLYADFARIIGKLTIEDIRRVNEPKDKENREEQ
ncbi:hypothetical protein [Bifidobacterium felsineum]|uniref:hypothetical protein n=1 Tax=Bifidobacterium felsineum TaxID=2045440 RepID=UPI001BDBCAAC|nr:hypothetical protein [Bifidobacterium felsineum]MBT1164622.1 hypothetical protein [Bifidobacterium felsineum]